MVCLMPISSMVSLRSVMLVLCTSGLVSCWVLNASSNEQDSSWHTYLQSMSMTNIYSDVMGSKVELAIIGDEKAVFELAEMFFSESYGIALMGHCEAGGKDYLWTKYGSQYAYKTLLSILARKLADSDDERIVSVLERYYYGDDQALDSGNVTLAAVKRIMHIMLPLSPDVTETPPIDVITRDFDNSQSTGEAVIRYLGSRVVIEFLLKKIGSRSIWIPNKYSFKGVGAAPPQSSLEPPPLSGIENVPSDGSK